MGLPFKKNRSIALLLVGAVIHTSASVVHAQQAPESKVFVSEASVPVVLDVDLSNLPDIPKWQLGDPIDVAPEHSSSGIPTKAIQGWTDSVLQLDSPLFSGNHLFSFSAHPEGNSNPPDPVGSIGPNHYVSMVNASQFAVWDKQGNNLARSRFNFLFTTPPCDDGDGDPIVQYDHAADRWLLSQFEMTGNTFCIAISRGADPVTSGWYLYDFSAPAFPDYPQYGVWNDAYFVSAIEISDTTIQTTSQGIYAFDRTSMLAGRPATFQRFTIPRISGASPGGTILPSDAEGATPPPVGAPAMFLRTVHASQDNTNPNTRIELWEYAVDFGNSANSSFTLAQSLTPAAYELLACSPSVSDCIPQPNTDFKLWGLTRGVMPDLKYRNFSTHESMVVSQVVDVGAGVGGQRWWELRRTPTTSGVSPWAIHQEGTYSPDDDHRFMGSIAMNGNGDIALGYSVSSSETLPEIRVTARRASDPLGKMTMNELTLAPGQSRLTTNRRWGDYSAMDVDPVDDETFWYINQVVDPVAFRPNKRNVWVGVFDLTGGPTFTINQGVAGAWFNAATSGQGVLFDIEPNTEFIFGAIFTYDTAAAAKLGAPEHRWLTVQGNYSGNSAELPIFVTSGGLFDQSTGTTTVPVGTATVTFSSCTEGSLAYILNDPPLSGTIPLQRVIAGTETLCEQLATP